MEDPGSGGTGSLSSAGEEERGEEEGQKGLPWGLLLAETGEAWP